MLLAVDRTAFLHRPDRTTPPTAEFWVTGWLRSGVAERAGAGWGEGVGAESRAPEVGARADVVVVVGGGGCAGRWGVPAVGTTVFYLRLEGTQFVLPTAVISWRGHMGQHNTAVNCVTYRGMVTAAAGTFVCLPLFDNPTPSIFSLPLLSLRSYG